MKVGLVIETLDGALKSDDEGAATKGQGRRRSGFRDWIWATKIQSLGSVKLGGKPATSIIILN